MKLIKVKGLYLDNPYGLAPYAPSELSEEDREKWHLVDEMIIIGSSDVLTNHEGIKCVIDRYKTATLGFYGYRVKSYIKNNSTPVNLSDLTPKERKLVLQATL